jgi:hypothetical protein
MNRATSLLSFLMLSLLSAASLGYTDFSNPQASKSVVIVKVKGLLGSDPDINAVALTPNLLLATLKSVSGLSVKLTIDGKDAKVVNSYKTEGLALLSYPAGGLTPAILSRGPDSGESKRIIHAVSQNGDPVSGSLIDFNSAQLGIVGMSMSKALLSQTGAGVFNNCGELVGIYDQSTNARVATAISLPMINSAIVDVSGTNYSATDCPSEAEKRVFEEDIRTLAREKADAEAEEKQKTADETLRLTLEKNTELEEAARKELSEVERKSKKSIEEIQAELALAKKEVAEKEALAEEQEALAEETEALAEQAKLKIEAEKLAIEESLRESKEELIAAAAKQDKQQETLLMIGAIVLGLLLVVAIIIYFRRSKKTDNDDITNAITAENAETLAFDILIRGENVGVKIPAELIARPRGVVIGRSAADCDFVMDSPEVSRAHIRLSEKDGVLYIEDLGSANGTVLNGLSLKPAQPVAMHHGDALELAVSMFSVEFREQ